jgi:hypothetical protein
MRESNAACGNSPDDVGVFNLSRSFLKRSRRCCNITPPKGKTSSVLTSSFRTLQVCISQQKTLCMSYSPTVFYGTLLLASSFFYWKDWPVIAKSLSLSDASRVSYFQWFLRKLRRGTTHTQTSLKFAMLLCSMMLQTSCYNTHFLTKLVGLQIKPHQYFTNI